MKSNRENIEQIHQKSSWFYSTTWFLKENIKIFEGEVEEIVQSQLNELCEAYELSYRGLRLETDRLELVVQSDFQINGNKVLKNLQKKFTRLFLQELSSLGIGEKEIWQEKDCLITWQEGLHETNVRINKLLNAVQDISYYDIRSPFTEDIEAFTQYLSHKQLATIEYEEQFFLVDLEALEKKINLNCFACTKHYKYGCCCGSPCNLSSKNKMFFDVHRTLIEEEIKALDKKNYEAIMKKGGLVASDGSINEVNGHCALLVEHEGVYKCISHKYGLDHHIAIYKICPLSCLMYPLEVMELVTDKQRKIILLTSVVDEYFADHYGRWGSYNTLDVELRCINEKAHNEMFKKADYKPVYEVNKGLLVHEFGETLYKGLMRIYKGYK